MEYLVIHQHFAHNENSNPTLQLTMRLLRSWAKHDYRGKLKKGIKSLNDKFDPLIKIFKKKRSGVSHPVHNDSNDHADDLQGSPTIVEAEGGPYEIQKPKKRNANSELKQGSNQNVGQPSLPVVDEGGTINDSEEDVSNSNGEENDEQKNPRYDKGKRPVTNDEDQIPQQPPATSFPPRSSSRNALKNAAGSVPSQGQVPSRREQVSSSRNVPTHAAGPASPLGQVRSRREQISMHLTPSVRDIYHYIVSRGFLREE